MEKRLVEDVIQSIHGIIRLNNYRLSEEQLEKADREIRPFIEETIELDENKYRVVKPNSSIKIDDKCIYPAVIRYFALTQDNLDLLEELEKQNFSFGGASFRFHFYALERQLSSKFSRGEYLRMLKYHNESVMRYMESLLGMSKEERESNISDFAEIVHADSKTLDVGKETGRGYSSYSFLIRRNIEYFGKDYLIHTTKSQRNIINSMQFRIEKESVPKIKEILEKYPYRVPLVPLIPEVLEVLSVNEIGRMSMKDANLYNTAIHRELLPRIKSLLQKDPNFDCPQSFIRMEIFKALDDDTILGLTEEAKMEISNMRFLRSEQAYIIPVRKINRVLFQDKIRKKKMELEDKFAGKYHK